MTLAVAAAPDRTRPKVRFGHAKPRIAPPTPARSDVPGLKDEAGRMGISLLPWQEVAARYLTATDAQGRHLYREVAILVARQNGKTALMKPYLVKALRAGKRVLHIAQTRELPREMFGIIADALSGEPDLFPKRRGRTVWPRYGSGQEEIRLANGGTYRIAAANRGGARGQAIDVLVIDELREMVDDDVLNAALPTLTAAPDPHIVYLSNAGTEESVVLNGLRLRAGKDPALAWLEWSAAPDRDAGDREGWAEANPSLGHFPNMLRELEADYRARQLDGKMTQFEVEHLCRWVPTMRRPLVAADAWAACETETLGEPRAPHMAVSMDPAGKRASAALAWLRDDDTIALRLLFDVTGNPIDTNRLGKDLRDAARRLRVLSVGFDPMADATLARYLARPVALSGALFANASSAFVSAVRSGRLRWADAAATSTDLTWTTRKENDEKGSFEAVRGDDARPITAALAAVRAVWLASRPQQTKRRSRTAGF